MKLERAVVATVWGAVLLACLSWPLAAQDYVLSATDADIFPGDTGTVQILFDNDGGDVQGWSFGICHDTTFATMVSAVEGSTTLGLGGAGPDFLAINTEPGGVTMFVVISFLGSMVLGPGTSYELLDIDYLVDVSASGSSTVECCTTLGVPPASVEFVVGGFPEYPDCVAGTIGPGGPPVVTFGRGDVNQDGALDISDGIFLLASLFTIGAPAPGCDDSADGNDDGMVDISDVIYLLASLFTPGSPPPPEPTTACGPDPTDDVLDCATFVPCP